MKQITAVCQNSQDSVFGRYILSSLKTLCIWFVKKNISDNLAVCKKITGLVVECLSQDSKIVGSNPKMGQEEKKKVPNAFLFDTQHSELL